MSFNILNSIKKIISTELSSLEYLLTTVDDNYSKVISLLYNCKGKLIIVGVGKSGYIAQKIAATMTSAGTPAFFLHPTEASHGDLGMVAVDDIVIIISNSGESEEIMRLLPSFKRLKCPIVAICSRTKSTLAQKSDYLLKMAFTEEACSINMVPTSSTLVSLVIGDALAVTLMEMKKFGKTNFAKVHPAGSLGKRMLLKVEDLMRQQKNTSTVTKKSTFQQIILAISDGMVNAVPVIDNQSKLLGLITGYDIRQVFQKEGDLTTFTAEKIMNKKPITYPAGSSAYDALLFMKQSNKSFNVMPIVDGEIVVGMLSMQDLVRSGL